MCHHGGFDTLFNSVHLKSITNSHPYIIYGSICRAFDSSTLLAALRHHIPHDLRFTILWHARRNLCVDSA